MLRRPTCAKRTDTLLPYTTLFRFAEDAVAVCDYVIEIEDGARLDFHILNMGGKLGRVSLDVTLGEGAHFELGGAILGHGRSEEHTSELQSLMRISYAVFCLKKKKHHY